MDLDLKYINICINSKILSRSMHEAGFEAYSRFFRKMKHNDEIRISLFLSAKDIDEMFESVNCKYEKIGINHYIVKKVAKLEKIKTAIFNPINLDIPERVTNVKF